MTDESGALPRPEDWARLDVTCFDELHGGHQSRVFRADRGGQAVVVKLTDGRLVDDSHARRVELVADLAQLNTAVVRPILFDAGLVVSMGHWLVVAYPEVVGAIPDVSAEHDVRTMAETLAELHRSFRMLGVRDIPAVAALQGGTDADWPDRTQLLHGDFSNVNIRFVDGEAKVFDFDDCGYGPVDFELGNTLYMVLFDAAMDGDEGRFDQFRVWFLDSYCSAAGSLSSDAEVDRYIAVRIEALSGWLDDLSSAPIGVRTASVEWLQKLRSFVEAR